MSTTVTKVLRLVLLFFLIFAIVSLLKNTVGLVEKGLVVRKEQKGLEQLKRENQQLRAWLDYVKTDDFLEQEARNDLGLTKEESVLILPEGILGQGEKIDDALGELSPWRQWRELFF